MILVWHVEVEQKVCEKFVGCNGDESLQIDGHSWIERDGRAATLRLRSWTQRNIGSSDLVLESVSV